jgi:hypothetical protein
MEEEWRVYNHGLISNKMPHEEKNVKSIEKLEKWKDKKTLFARWTSEFDCKEETQWWYCLKDDEYDISSLKAKRRYVINKGIKNFDVKVINPKDYYDEMYEVYKDSLSEYPKKYRNIATKEEFLNENEDVEKIYIGAWDKETKKFSGYAICGKLKNDECVIIELKVVKVMIESTKKEINAAIMNYICCKFLNEEHVKYIYDGERNIRHITNYQEYLIKYFGFRKAYCKLNIKYKTSIKLIVNILYPFRGILKNTNNKLLYNIYCVLFQEEIRRSFNK